MLIQAAALALVPAVGLPAEGGTGDRDPAAGFVKEGRLDLDAVVRHFEDLYRSSSSISTVELIVTRSRLTKKMAMRIWTLGADKALVVIQAPARERGIATLKVGKNLWNYMPRIRRTILIPPP